MPAPYNNGTVIDLPSVASSGALSVAGSIYLGIGTTSGNTIPAATVINTDSNGFIVVTMNSTDFTRSFMDSGSGSYAADASYSAISGILPLCSASGYTSFFCPTSPYSATLALNNIGGTQSGTASITIANTQSLFINCLGCFAFNNVGGDLGAGWQNSMDLGLPFFFGKKIATGLWGTSAQIGGAAYTGPYFAYPSGS
jgi:hypothetical protein